jgi:hypothetical protein
MTDAKTGRVDLENTNLGTPEDREKFFETIREDPVRRIAELCVANYNNVEALQELAHRQTRIDQLLTAVLSVLASKSVLTEKECNAIFEASIAAEVAKAEAQAEGNHGEKTSAEGIITPGAD